MQRKNLIIPEHLLTYTLRFLSGHDWRRAQCVSRKWKILSTKLIIENIFYIVGDPVVIATSHKDYFQCKKITASAIKSAIPIFTANDMIGVFPTAQAAYTFARSLRTNQSIIDSENIRQPLVYGIQFLKEKFLKENLKETKKIDEAKSLEIEESKEDKHTIAFDQPLELKIQDYIERNIEEPTVSYFKSKSQYVIPLFGIARITQPKINFQHPQEGPIVQDSCVSLEVREDKVSKLRCVIL